MASKTKCDRCASPRLASMSAKCSDMCGVNMLGGKERDGYVCFAWCLECGKIQNDDRRYSHGTGAAFPLPPCELESEDTDA